MDFLFVFKVLWGLVGNHLSQCLCSQECYISNLNEHVEDLETAIQRLKDKRADVLRTISDEEKKGFVRRNRVGGWLLRVEKIEVKVGKLLDAKATELDRLCLYGYCSTKLKSSYDYGKKVQKNLKEIAGLEKEEGDFDGLVDKPPTPTVETKDIQSKLVGLDSLRQRAWDGLMKDEVGIFGLYGMGGVGKTTLLKHINNNFSQVEKEFDIVIWVVVSRVSPIESIQKQIGARLGFGEQAKGSDIRNALSGKRFVLFLDDLWSEVDLSEIGVPSPTEENKYKVVFTTRSEKICIRMNADDKMEVKCLSDVDAWDLFQRIVGEMALTSHPEIPNLARQVAEKCGNLPLALNVIGKAMAPKNSVEQWRHAINVLDSSSPKFPGMKSEILQILRFSYDHLENEEVKMCFLYCALFPEDHKIDREQLIDYWICEGYINTKGSGDRDKALDEGHDIISTLISAYLLMDNDPGNCAKMHDVIREMALWIASDCGKREECYIVKARERLRRVPDIQNRKEVRKMSLMNNEIEEIDGDANCPELTTLFLQTNKVKKISGEFFRGMRKLMVLELSWNHNLVELPEEVSQLASLRYLDLSVTAIKQLPAGLQELRELTHLNLEFTCGLAGIGWRISSLRNLQVLRLFSYGVKCDLQLLEEIQQLEHLADLTITVNGEAAERFLGIRRLTSITRQLRIERSSASVLVFDPAALGSLRWLEIEDSDIWEIKVPIDDSLSTPRFSNLSQVLIFNCRSLKDLTWLLFAPNLVSLVVWDSPQVEEIINGEKAEAIRNGQPPITPFEKLERLELLQLKKLKSICPGTLPFPNLNHIEVWHCPELRRLPLDSESAKKGIRLMRVERSWAERAEWEDDATKQRFLRRSL
ncbi:PREDICTED: probable disease resistance protein At5g63020 [Tarenaya hassleriana]|uniref:probable disease resistance protein At5g63020 n=1 Tax=Tarenaya hassleriana TaxID=28532 RepID=UPI00053C9F1D|nr:PREDICTED: probable disease resistance protein At5g63020 [Tarenaya hassleriana]